MSKKAAKSKKKRSKKYHRRIIIKQPLVKLNKKDTKKLNKKIKRVKQDVFGETFFPTIIL